MIRRIAFTILAVLTTVGALATPEVRIIPTENTAPAGYTKFVEPTVAVYDGDNDVTSEYIISYGFADADGNAIGTDGVDSRGVKIVTDPTTGSYIEKYFSQLTIGRAGDIKVMVTATSKSDATAKYYGYYTVAISAPVTSVVFSPAYPTDGLDLKARVTSNQYNASQWYITNVQTILPAYKVQEDANGSVTDITDYFDCTVAYSGNSVITYDANNKRVSYAGDTNNNQYYTEDAAIAAFPTGVKGTLTYTFTPKAEHANVYSVLTQTIPVKLSQGTESIHLELTRDMIPEENVTGNETDGYTIHVYKYGEGVPNNNYQYPTPNPALLTTGGARLSFQNGRVNKGNWGDFQLLCIVEEGHDGLGTYYDNCQYAPFFNNEADVAQKAGEAGTLGSCDPAGNFQVAKPGLVKVACYAVLPDNYGDPLKAIFEPYKRGGATAEEDTVVTFTQNYGKYTAYTAPVYFYIDVMKRVPTLKFSPDPSTLTFGKGDKIDMHNRFEVSGYKDDSSDGKEGYLLWGAGDNSEYIAGMETDHFAYSFFISDRASSTIKINDWPYSTTKADWDANGGDRYSFYDYQNVTEKSKTLGKAVQAGDIIKDGKNYVLLVGDTKSAYDTKLLTDGIMLGGVNTTLTEAKASDYASRTLAEGDMERGITYYSTKGYGEAFEKWTMEFAETGEYPITYTIRPWNHVRWDIGSSDAGSVTYTYTVKEKIPTVIDLSYDFQVADVSDGWNYEEPDAKVLVPSKSNADVTKLFNVTYTFDVPADYTMTSEKDPDGHAGTYNVLKNADNTVIAKINTTTGEVFIGNVTDDVKVKVSGTQIDETGLYENPADAYYTIRIVDNRATWEIINKCNCTNDIDSKYTKKFSSIEEASGRFHFLTSGKIYGGTVITGVPGISMTVGVKDDNTWSVEQNTTITSKCDNHESDNNYSAVVVNDVPVSFAADDDKEGIPVSGAFIKFQPTTNGYLTVDANQEKDTKFVLVYKDSKNNKIYDETYDVTADNKGDFTFEKPLIAGETYYLYNITSGTMRLHGFGYEPAFILNRNTTKAESTSLVATTFLNALSTNMPELLTTANSNVTFQSSDANYATIVANGTGKPTPIKMTLDQSGNISTITITATVKSSDAELANCVYKQPSYSLKIIDIPTYKITESETGSDFNFTKPTKVTTTNISTDMTMTFGCWDDSDDKYGSDDSKQDKWSYKSAAGAASRIGSELADNNPTYNITIDGFDFYNAASNNPVDENNKSALITTKETVNNGNSYTYASGVKYENSEDTYYNTTYKLPCRGAFLKFEPRESGIVLLYLVQNGSIDYHHGVTDCSKAYQVKWRPLYITDETGKPATMVTDANFGDVSKYLPTGADNTSVGYFTMGVSRCNKEEDAISNYEATLTNASELTKVDNCSFDWSEFRGTATDQSKLLEAWQNWGDRESIVKLENGGFVLPHKAYVRYAFNVKAGKTYFVFQPASKFEFGGYSFVPKGFPDKCKYALVSNPDNLKKNDSNQELNFNGTSYQADGEDITFTWNDKANFTADKENICVTINDRRASEISSDATIVPRKLVEGKWTSLCLPFSVSSDECKRVFGDNYVLVTFNGTDESERLHFIRHANTYMEAGRPYFIKPSKTVESLSFRNVTIEAEETTDGTTKVIDPTRFNYSIDNGGYTFKGIYKRETINAGSYFMMHDYSAYDTNAGDGLYTFNADSKIGGYRAYLCKNPESTSGAKGFAVAVEDKLKGSTNEDTTTGILYITTDNEIQEFPANAGVYSLDGQKLGNDATYLNNAPQGVYIINGKKVLVK